MSDAQPAPNPPVPNGSVPPVALDPHDVETCLSVLQAIADSNGELPRSDRMNSLISKIYREGRKHDKQRERARLEAEDRAIQAQTVMVQVQRDAIPAAKALPPPPETQVSRVLNIPEACYICKAEYTQVHFFYHLLCPTCAAFNFEMREVGADLKGRTALITGGRVKIGHQMVLRLLRDGAKVIITTRFPHAAARRLDAEPDADQWRHRVHLYGLDLRNIPAIEQFIAHLYRTEPHLDIMIHNAAQTIRRPNGFYDELLKQERHPELTLPPGARELVKMEAAPQLNFPPDSTAAMLGDGDGVSADALTVVKDVLPVDRLEDNEERADSRNVNSWLLRLDQVGAPELLEVQLVNQIAPFILNGRLRALMKASPFERKFIVNVSAMEGQFSRHKTVFHPHTNMAKAALNMMTRTSGEDYAEDGIYMTSVDTGWVTDENPTLKRERGQNDRAFFPPLDITDGMARIYHPVAHGITKPETPHFGVFLKDYKRCPW